MSTRWVQWLVAGLTAGWLSGCPDCGGEEFLEVAPRISVDACKSGQGTSECMVDFGEVALSTRASHELRISNPSGIQLTLQEPTFSDETDPAFRVDHWPDRIAAGLESSMVVSFRPLVESAVEGVLEIHSDAANVPSQEPVLVELRGRGVDNGLPQIEIVARSPCVGTWPGSEDVADLGITAVAHAATCTFEIFNRGSRDLVIEEISYDAESTDNGFDFVGRVPGVDPDTGERFESVIPPPEEGTSSSRSFVARGVPSELGTFAGLILVQTNDPGCVNPQGDGSCRPEDSRTLVQIPVTLEGALTPTAVAEILSVNGSEDFDPRQIEPLDDVVLTAEESFASSRSLRISEYRWEIIEQPPGSHGFLDNPGSATPRFMFDNSRNIVAGVDLAGFWAVRLTVVDSRGASSVNEAVVTFNAVPTDAIHIQLVWDHPNSDVDLHLLRDISPPGSTTPEWDSFSSDDCYFGNCKVAGGGLEWFPGEDESNPTLDVDDLYGYGPENINIDTPHTGRYMPAVHYYSDHGEGDTVAVIRLFVFGNLHSEYLTDLADSDWWEVAIIEWPSREITTSNVVTPGSAPY